MVPVLFKLKSAYLSIVDLPQTDLPSFTVITGINGAGKTHFLKAITGGMISVDIVSDPARDTRYFDWNNLIPKDAAKFDGQSLLQGVWPLSDRGSSRMSAADFTMFPLIRHHSSPNSR